ncbi:recombinase family protein [Rhodoblastus sp. 17X3]|uniref:recombinase family protein n=1 Tax=Rhodoblastus sp. 17X3 TaxID=3047026 RepID=UPI0024B702D5|nr:recombinase family protein [Rhodoblastus sp. 17X3]MDI9850045.1 recombinase family protein [Rhodoblastus sp. 17X3]
MKQAAPKHQRCAIYTRKSTEHNLDLAFNSLDAQREACEAYIKSQAHEGWMLVPAHFDDGGLSGASLDRPALQFLLDQVRARKIDIIVVYKVDRLTRSLADFAKLVELFDEHDVSFVSVTQSFNTTSSMGRLTLNVLLSFAQFEREVIGERVRDKIAASKRKGIWVGGPVPLGYRSVDKKLQVVPDEADLVRKIFKNYLAIGSLSALAASLNAEGLKPKPRQLTNGRAVAADCYRVGPLAHLLKNRFYIGEIVYRGEVHQGEHEPILERDLFEAAQTLLMEKTVERSTIRASSPSLLTGRIFDNRNNPMTPTHANKNGVRYRYYVSHALLQGQKAEVGSVARVSAPDVELLIANFIRAASAANHTASDRELIREHVARAIVGKDHIEIVLRHCDAVGAARDPDDTPMLSIPFTPNQSLQKGVAHAPSVGDVMDEATRSALLSAIARSRAWVDAISADLTTDFRTISEREKLAERHVRFLAPLAYLSPRIIEAITEGRVPADLTVTRLARGLPMVWAEQEKQLGFA